MSESEKYQGDIYAGRVLFVGNSYYHTWYLSRELRKIGWKADVVNMDLILDDSIYYHGQDYQYRSGNISAFLSWIIFYMRALFRYDIFHFSNAHGLTFKQTRLRGILPPNWDIWLIRKLGKKIVYSNNGCLDGVAQSSFMKWQPVSVCEICAWKDQPEVCSDTRNLSWGKYRNEMSDYQITIGGNRVDYNDSPAIHEVPEFYCMDMNVWNPELLLPSNYLLPVPKTTLKIFHSIGNYYSRTEAENKQNIKCTHIYVPLIEQLKNEGYDVELIFFHDVPNTKIKYYQVQADIVVDMLTFGFFGANVREALMLGKPCICFLRPEWLESMRKEIPEYVDELPVVNATPDTIYDVLKDLVENPRKRQEIGRRSREFAVKWHSSEVAARKLNQIYRELLNK